MVSITVAAARHGEVSRPSFSKSLSAWLNATPSLVIGTVETARWRAPGSPTPLVREEARAGLAAYERYLAPGPQEQTSAALAVTLRMFFDRDFEPGVDEAVIEAWLMDLGDLPAWAVEHACGLWRRTEEKRPTVAGIRRLAVAEIERDRETMRRLRLTLEVA